MSTNGKTDEIVKQSAARWPEHAAVIDWRGTFSYRELCDASVVVCCALREAGVVPGSIVGISVVDARGFLAALFGVLEAGGVAIPVAPNAAEAERLRVIAESGVAWLVSDQRMAQTGLGIAAVFHDPTHQVVVSDEYLLFIRGREAAALHPEIDRFPDAAVIRHTSGTTGRSKGVVLSHRAVLERTEASIRVLGITHNDVMLTPLSLSYHFIASALSCVRAGTTILDCVELSAAEMLHVGLTHGATFMYAAPIQYEEICRTGAYRPLPALRRAISTSALLSTRIVVEFFQRFAIRLTQVYGIIEVGLPLWNELESVEPSALGICKSPYEAKVVDERGVPLPLGEVGELAIRGPGLFSGYLVGAASEASSMLAQVTPGEGWFLTGDVVTQDQLGIILYRGRKKSVINCGGNKVFPEEVEEVLMRSPEIKAARVSAKPHPSLGSVVVAEIVLGTNQAPCVDAWRALCLAELSEYKVPHEFRVVDSLPTTGSGKIVR